MNDDDIFIAKRVDELRQNIDFSDIPEIKDFSLGYLRNLELINKPTSIRIDLNNLEPSD